MAKKTPTAAPQRPDIELVEEPLTEEQSLVKQDGDIIRTFIGGAVAFFTKAGKLERAAKERLDIAKQRKALIDKGTIATITRDIDEQIQMDLRADKLARTAVDDHWKIAQAVSRFHKRLTGARERAGSMADEAAEINQALHNGYVREQQRIAREKEEKARRDEEARLRAEQEAEAARLDEEALKAEATSPTLSDREEAFVNGIINRGLSPFEAAKAAQFKKPAAEADRLMASRKIQQALDAKKAAVAAREQAAATRDREVNVVVEKVRPNVSRVGGGFDRKTWSGVVDDEASFIAAVLDPLTRTKLGIPADVLTINLPKLNEYARALHEKMNAWPGVHADENTNSVTR